MRKDRESNQLRTYRVQDIQKILDISRTAAYKLVKSGSFRVVHIGTAIRVPRDSFDSWLLDGKSDDPGQGGH